MGAGFQGHVGSGTARLITGLGQRFVRGAEALGFPLSAVADAINTGTMAALTQVQSELAAVMAERDALATQLAALQPT